MGRPPRLSGFDYIGLHAYFVTICTRERRQWFTDGDCAAAAQKHLLRTAADYGFDLIAYCLMPDHVHALTEATRGDSDFRRFVSMFKQRSAYEHRRRFGGALWQESFQEHTLRSDQQLEPIAAHIVGNPIRAGLCSEIDNHPFLGSSRYSIEQLRDSIQIVPFRKGRRPRRAGPSTSEIFPQADNVTFASRSSRRHTHVAQRE
jgi:REP element-mobilizing transposase RayT